MQIVINCLGMPFNGDTVEKGTIGGSESAAYYLARELARRGHDVKIFTSATEGGLWDGVTYLPAGAVTEAAPMGADFHFYAEHTPHDVLIVQRQPMAFRFKYASRINLLWLHDLALYRHRAQMQSVLWNVDGVLCVSDYHKAQVRKVWDLPDSVLFTLRNGIDLDAIRAAAPLDLGVDVPRHKRLFYMSRPERGLDHLLALGGIMDQLPDHHLYFCTYNNVAAHMRPQYEAMWRRAERMPNVHNLGFLNKGKLYSAVQSMGLLVYPTPGELAPDFREVSCIAAMEAMGAGLPMLTTGAGALAETTAGSGTITVSDVRDFPQAVRKLSQQALADLSAAQDHAALSRDWSTRAEELEEIILDDIIFGGAYPTEGTRLRHLIRHSAISEVTPKASQSLRRLPENFTDGAISAYAAEELVKCYDFYPLDSYANHYAEYYAYEADRGVDYGPEKLDGNPRFELVAELLKDQPAGAWVLDYGCAHGHYTVNLAKRYPHLLFVGVDIAQSNVDKARAWADAEQVNNVSFHRGEVDAGAGALVLDGAVGESPLSTFRMADCLIVAEVLEHVRDPDAVLSGLLRSALRDGGQVIVTTPFGPWEAAGYRKHWPWRAHVHDFTRRAIEGMLADAEDLRVRTVSSGRNSYGEALGSYVYTFTARRGMDVYELPARELLDDCGAVQTVSLCMIVRDDWRGLQRCLDSCAEALSEIVVGIDRGTHPDAVDLLIEVIETTGQQWKIPAVYAMIDGPLVTGFDAARNSVCDLASGDWVLWLDVDEIMVHPDRLVKYLRHNSLNAYQIAQHHFSADPPTVIKVDYPSKLFRRNAGLRFIGRIHEHPESGLNEGTGVAFIVPDMHIIHFGYHDEDTRRDRFKRNFPLLERDRQDYPGRHLGAFFWLRDMAQACQFLAELGQREGDEFRKYLQSGFDTWPQVLATRNAQLIMEACRFYSGLVLMKGGPCVTIKMHMSVDLFGGAGNLDFDGSFRTKQEAREVLDLLQSLQIDDAPEEDI